MSRLPGRAAVAVLGPYDQSPRMRYHARALAAAGVSVVVIAMSSRGGDAAPDREDPIHLQLMPNRRRTGAGPLFAVRAALRAVAQGLDLAWAFLRAGPIDVLLLQTPPPLPILPIAWLAARLRGARLIVDWHNFSSPLLALRLGQNALAARLTERLEGWFARRGDAHICVSRAMAERLSQRHRISATVFPDRPADAGRGTPGNAPLDRLPPPLTGQPRAGDRLLVSATSWSDDEDFSLLLEALNAMASTADSPSDSGLHLVITGKGPRRALFERRCRESHWPGIAVTCGWLTEADYWHLLAAADAGLCLHRSASGVDLPMKALDYLGAGLPVLAYDYGPCLRELLHPGRNAVLFTDAAGLAGWLSGMRDDRDVHSAKLKQIRTTITANPLPTWNETWHQTVPPLLRQAMEGLD